MIDIDDPPRNAPMTADDFRRGGLWLCAAAVGVMLLGFIELGRVITIADASLDHVPGIPEIEWTPGCNRTYPTSGTISCECRVVP